MWKTIEQRDGSGLQCCVCGKIFTGDYCKSNLRQHMTIHRGEKPFQCPYCNHASNRKNNLKMHIKFVHMQKNESISS